MNYLNKVLAQEIVDRTMKIIERNINVMNHEGVILGSGDKSRIDQIHEGAIKVIECGAQFDIHETESEELHGVKAGINLPIMLKGEIVGVIGITGFPEEVRSFGELVQMAAEMIIQQAVWMEQIQWDERLKEELVSQLLHQPEQLDALFFERARRLGIDLDVPRMAVILTADDPASFFKKVTERLGKNDLYVIEQKQLVVLKNVSSGHDIGKQALNWINGFEAWGIPFKVSAGSYYEGKAGMIKSYQEAVTTLYAAKMLDPDKTVYLYEEYKIPVFLARAAQHGILEKIGVHSQQLKEHDLKKGQLIDTLLAYIEANGDIQMTAKKLFIHRNTLRYRMGRIEEITGKNPYNVKDLLELYLSILQEKIACANAQ